MNEYGQLLKEKETRIRRDLKISDVVKQAGCSAGYLCDIENGKRFGKIELHRKIWSALYLEASEVEPIFNKAKADHVIEVARKRAAELRSDASPENAF